MLLLCALIVGSGTMWAEEETIASFSASVYNGGTTNEWTVTNADYATANSGYYKLISNDASIVTPNINWSDYKDITITISARKYGGPDATQGKISVSQGTTELASYSPSGTSIAASSALAITPADGTITISCPGASSSKGCGVQSIVIKGTKSSGGGDTPTTWTVTYDGNGASSGTVPVDNTEYNAQNNTVTVLGNTGSLAKEHYTFNNWNTADDGSGTGYVAGNTFTISGNTTLYAQWAINSYNVTLPAQDEYGAYEMNVQNPVAYGTEVTLTYTPATGYENYVATWSVNGTALEDNKFTMPDEAVTVTVSVAEKTTSDMTIDFENAASTYSDWTFTNIVSNYSNTGVNAHGGSKYGSTNGKASGSIQTKEKVNPASLTCYVSKQTTNTTSSTWYIQVSSDGSTWEDAKSRSATNMDKGEWVKFSTDLSDYSDVYVRVSYSGSTAVRLIDDLTLEIKNDERAEAGLAFNESSYSVELVNAASFTSPELTNPHELPITWTSSNETVATVNEGTVTILSEGETTIKASFDGDNNYKKGEASYTLTVQDSRTALVLSFDPESVEVNVNETVAIPTLNGNLGNGAVTYASDDETIATVTEDANTSLVVTGLAEGTTTITATVAATNEYKEGTATFTVTVIDPNKKGSVNNPYTVDEARAAIDAGTGVTEVYATGIVSEIVTAFNSQYGNITYNISADGLTTSDQLQAYRGKGIGGANFTSEDDIKVGDVVVIYGDLKKHGSTYEFGEGNQLVSLERPSVPAIIVADPTINVNASSQSITRGITVNNLTISDADNFHIKYYNANDEEVEKPSWIEEATVTMENSAYVLSCTVAANEGDERTAYLKVYAMNGDETIYSNLVTITQAKYVPDYATLPFEFNDGRADIEETDGLTQNGLGSDYNANNNPTTKLKFDSTGDWMILKINEIPGTLTFDIKGNSFSGGTFKVQTSADGTTYTDLATYKDLGDTQTETFNNLEANVRYIKWIYTNKSTGNVGLGNITLGNTMAVAIAAACTDGTKCYSTFSSSKPFIVPEDLTVSEIGIEDGTMNVVNYATGETVPANTGVMVSATDGGNYVVNISKEAGTSKLATSNALRPSGDDGITADEMDGKESGCKFYRLTMHGAAENNPGKIGFWWGADGGDSFAIAANKAYLAVPASSGAREGFAFDDDSTTGISNVNVNENVNGSVFDLQGRKVSTPGKGLYIVNGKKVVIK